MSDIWTTSRMMVFTKYDDWFLCHPYVGIVSIEFGSAVNKTCSYCGHEYNGLECPGCSARKEGGKFHAGKAIVELNGLLPMAEWLTNPPSEILCCVITCGPPERISNADDIIHMNNCKLESALMEFSLRSFVYDEECVVNSTIECDVVIEHKRPPQPASVTAGGLG